MSFSSWILSPKSCFAAASTRGTNRNSRRAVTRQASLVLEMLEDRLAAATLMVNSTVDVVNPSNGTLSLRDAISAVNAGNANGLTSGEQNQVSGTFGTNDTIEFSSALNGDTITLTANGSALEISKNLTITGLGASNLAISGNYCRVFTVDSGAQVSITGLTIQNGLAGDAGDETESYGGGIYNAGTLTVSNCTLSNNGAAGEAGDGGGIYNKGTLTVSNSTLTGNSGSQFILYGSGGGLGGGIYNTGTLSVTNSTVSNNSSAFGGGIYNSGTLNLTSSTFAGNSVSGGGTGDGGGGIFNASGTLTVVNSTLSNNSVTTNLRSEGGGIYNAATLVVTNSTLSGNSATTGGGIANGQASTTLNNTIVANNTAGGDLSGSGFAGAYDLIGDGSDLSSSFTNSLQGNPQLAPLANNGGSTQTMALKPGSPAINAGSNSLAVDAQGNALTADQTGQPRIVGTAVDLGAVESQVIMLNATAPQTVQTVADGTGLSLTVTDPSSSAPIFSLSGNVPAGAKIDAQTGVFTWTPSQTNGIAPGVYSVTVVATEASDPQQQVGTATFSITVGPSSTNQGSGMAARMTVALGLGQSQEYYNDFVAAAYEQYLGRSPKQGELPYWVNQMLAGTLSDQQLEADFLSSQESLNDHGGANASWVQSLYTTFLGRMPQQSEVQYWVNQLNSGMTPMEVALGFTNSQEHEMDVVVADYQHYLGRSGSASEIQYWVNVFKSGGSGEQVIASFISSQEYFQDNGSNIVDWLYAAYRSIPNRQADTEGYQYWENQLQ
jgi:Domain of unknown function (DUF4214)